MFTNLHRVVRLPSSRAALAPRSVRFKFAVPDAETSPRRRRLKPKLVNSKFAALTAQFLDRVQTAVEPLLPPTNDAFYVDRTTKDVLMLRTDAKEFEIKIVSAKQQIHFTSPISGLRHYEWNAKTQRWEDETDSHDIEGLLTRDLMRLCSGVPQF